MNPGHQPERFEIYSILPDGKGFTVKDNPHVYLFDRYGGWYDQYDNYYNDNGDPEEPPASDSEEASQVEYQSPSEASDQFEKEYGAPRDLSDDQEFQLNQHQVETLARNLFNLQIYPLSQLLRVHFHKLPKYTRKDELLKAYNAHLDNGIVNVILDKDENGKNIGTGYFIVKPDAAQKLIKLQGQKIIQASLQFDIEDYQSFILFPIKEQELSYTPPEKVKKYVPKNPVKQEEKPIPSQPQIKWKWYKFEKDIFPKRSQFKTWMIENGFNAEQDFKNLQKLQNDPQKKYIKIEMKETTFNSINGVEFDGKAVQFTPI